MRKPTLFLIAIVLAGAAPAGAEEFDPAACAAAIAPFIDEQTLAIVRIDVTRIAPAAIADMVLAHAKSAGLEGPHLTQVEKAVRYGQGLGKQWIDSFRAAGGKDIYMAFSLALNIREPLFWVVPIGEDGDAETIGSLLISGKATAEPSRRGRADGLFPCAKASATLHGAVCAGSASALEALRQLRAHRRPKLVEAFAAAGPAAVQVLLLPTDDTRRIIEETLPALPPQLGGGPSTVVTRGLLWAAVGIDAPPNLSLRLTIQSQSPEAAKALRGAILSAFSAFGKLGPVKEMMPGFDKLTASLVPQATGDKLRLKLSARRVDELVQGMLTPSLLRLRTWDKRSISIENVHAICVAIQMYASDKDGQFPPDLSALKDRLGPRWEDILANPSRPERPVGYVYVRPSAKMDDVKSPTDTIVIYEAHDEWGEGINVGFADGHAEWIADQARFKKLLEKAAPAK